MTSSCHGLTLQLLVYVVYYMVGEIKCFAGFFDLEESIIIQNVYI